MKKNNHQKLKTNWLISWLLGRSLLLFLLTDVSASPLEPNFSVQTIVESLAPYQLAAVSYTHLDVYKRQLLSIALFISLK